MVAYDVSAGILQYIQVYIYTYAEHRASRFILFQFPEKIYASRTAADTIDYEEIKMSAKAAFYSSHEKESTDFLIDRFPLQFVEQLAVNPKKVDEVLL